MTDAILINPAYSNIIYKNTKVKVGAPISPLLNLPLLAKPVLDAGYKVKILDLNIEDDPDLFLEENIRAEKPKIVGITFTTPLYFEAERLASLIKRIRSSTILVAGGVHTATFPEDVIKGSFDVAVMGEADFVMRDLLTKDWKNIKGLVFKENGNIINTGKAEQIEDLDDLPLPAWNLYSLERYNSLSLSHRKSPPGYLETSRGCPYGCVFCNKNIQGRKFRVKSPKRVVDEIEYMLMIGFNEINILDDTFSTDLKRAKAICDEIINRDLKFPWFPLNGMRVDSLDKELLTKMKKAGCYKITLGIETGSQKVLNRIKKGINLQQVRDAVRWSRELGFETLGYFMFGLPGETEETMEETIKLAKELKLDFAKFNITIPLPGTELFNEWDSKGLIKTKDLNRYNFHSSNYELYDHPTLSHETIDKYYKKSYRSFYFSPMYLLRNFLKDLRDGFLLWDIRLFLQTNWLK
ncbi:MAG: B12-binding domain-containing radical SAM protein [Candidatus Omnitrophica bacterium]|nr:B12-binding domain-containing radical SAM protein [Candidatus Omnitrophota bacterium]